MQNQPPKRIAVARTFSNWTNEDFEWSWDGVSYHFPALSSMMMQEYLVDHFAKHLTDREMNKLNIPTNDPKREEFLKKCYKEDEIQAVSEIQLGQKIMNASTSEITPKPVEKTDKKLPDANGVYCQECGSRSPYFHKKTCSQYAPPKPKGN